MIQLPDTRVCSSLGLRQESTTAQYWTSLVKKNALLLTADKDFGELIFLDGESHSGVLLIRSF